LKLLMSPVAASNATMWLRVTGAPPPCGATAVNVPPRTTVPPTRAMASTSPSWTFGVYDAGTALTTVGCGVPAARAGVAGSDIARVAPTTATTAETAHRARERRTTTSPLTRVANDRRHRG